MQDTMWRCADGRQILVSQMETRHLANCINKILCSRNGWRRQYLERLQLELQIRALNLSSGRRG